MTNELGVRQLYDDLNSDRMSARYVAFNEPSLRAAQFVMIYCAASNRVFFGNVTGPALNFNRNSLSPTDNTAINQLEQIAKGAMDRQVAINEYFFYEITLLKEVVNGHAESVRVRPQIGAGARPATEREITDLLKLPNAAPEIQIGSLIDTKVPICVSKNVLMHHTLVAGSTGSGKTNTIASIVCAAISMGMCVLVFDHKPDYQHAHFRNDDGDENYYHPLIDVEYWYIGQPLAVDRRSENQISVAACDLDPLILVSTIFYRDGEELQAEICHYCLEQHIDQAGPRWTMDSFRSWIMAKQPAQLPIKPKAETFEAIKRKLHAPGRIPKWIDARPGTPTSRMFSSGPLFQPADLIKLGHVIVIRVGSEASDGREYGLLLSYILDKINQRAERHQLPCPMLISIDEAQDIFSASKNFKQIALGMLDRHIRKGRSKRIGYLIGVQAADAVPESIINNLNSRIIHRHNSYEQVRTAANMATEDQRKMTNTFGAGEALAFLNASNGIVHARMRRSPFKLTKEN